MRFFSKCVFLPFFLLIVISSNSQVNNFDYRVLRGLAAERTPDKNAFFLFISKWNNPVCLSAPAALFVTGLIKNDAQMKRNSLYVTESIFSASLVNLIIKKIVKRKRPYLRDPSFISVVPASNESFPSGHTAESFSMATSMTLAYPKWYIIAPTFAWASMIGYARMYLGVHFPTDVMAGATISSMISYLVMRQRK